MAHPCSSSARPSTSSPLLISASFGVIALAAGMMGWFVKALKPWERLVLIAAAVLLIKPGLYTDAVGYILSRYLYSSEIFREEH